MFDLHSMSPNPDPAEIVRIADVLEMTGLRRTMLYDLIGKGRFPTQVNLGARAVGWYKHEVLEWIRNRPAANRVGGGTGSNERKAFADLDTTSEILKTTTHQTDGQKEQRGHPTVSRPRKTVGAVRQPEPPMTKPGSSGAPMRTHEEIQLLRDENTHLKQLVGELVLKNSLLLAAAEHKRSIT